MLTFILDAEVVENRMLQSEGRKLQKKFREWEQNWVMVDKPQKKLTFWKPSATPVGLIIHSEGERYAMSIEAF
jgi:hypothetical protein